MPRKTTSRGYGTAHQAMRKRLRAYVRAGMATCVYCGLPISPTEKWHLGHDDSRTRWIGPTHALCNLREAGHKAQRLGYGRGQEWRSRDTG